MRIFPRKPKQTQTKPKQNQKGARANTNQQTATQASKRDPRCLRKSMQTKNELKSPHAKKTGQII
jgi:hypothetical protein